MDRKATTAALSLLLELHINPHNDPRIYMSKEVTFDYGTLNQVRIDYMRFVPVNNTISGIEKVIFTAMRLNRLLRIFIPRTDITL